MKILIVADMHMKYELPYSVMIKDGRKKEWENVKKTIINASKECDSIVLLGDQLNSRHNHSSVLTEFIDFLNAFGKKEIHILVGNHCRYGNSTALDFLKEINKTNWHIYTDLTQVKIGDKTAMMIPFVSPTLLGVGDIKQGNLELIKRLKKSDLAFAHLAMTESKNVGFFNEIMLNKKTVEKLFGHIFLGHIHKRERIGKNILVTGSIFTQEVGEYSKSIHIIDTKDLSKYEEIKLPVRGIYKIIWEETTDIKTIPKESIVKCYITKHETDIEKVKEKLNYFDAFIIVEHYKDEREKVYFEENGLDLSIDSLLKLYSKAKKIKYAELREGFNLIND